MWKLSWRGERKIEAYCLQCHLDGHRMIFTKNVLDEQHKRIWTERKGVKMIVSVQVSLFHFILNIMDNE